jgi:hypothetical protein
MSYYLAEAEIECSIVIVNAALDDDLLSHLRDVDILALNYLSKRLSSAQF